MLIPVNHGILTDETMKTLRTPSLLPVHSLPSLASDIPTLKLFRFKHTFSDQDKVQLPVTPLPTNAPHRHNYYEILFFEEGMGHHEIDFKTYPIHAPSVHFLAPGKVHLLTPASSAKGYIIAFSDDFYSFYSTPQSALVSQLPFFKTGNREPFLNLHPSVQTYFGNLIRNMVADFMEGSGVNGPSLGSYLHIFLQKCAQLYTETTHDKTTKTASSHLVEQFQQLVESQFKNKRELQYYAGQLAVTPDYISKSVKKTLGQTAGEYILDKILLEAKRLLVFTRLSSKEIAYQLNFDDPSYFSRIFKKKTGLTPNDYRSTVRKSTI